MHNDSVYIGHMLDCIAAIESFLLRFDREAFLTDRLVSDAFVRELEVIGEAAAKISPELRTRTPEIPWREVVGLRNKLIHDYIDVDLDLAWRICTVRLPELKQQLLLLS